MTSSVRPPTTVDDCRLIELPRIGNSKGELTFLENCRHVPFEIRRVFYLYGVPPGGSRGSHAHKTLHQAMICLAGSFDVLLDDGLQQRTVRLERPWEMLYVPPMIWDAELNFTAGSICLVMASDLYDEADYIRDYDAFLAAARYS